MRKFLLASVAALGTGGLIGNAVAQTPVVGAPTQGQTAFPMATPNASANNNNNYQAAPLPGVVANPTPGTIVIHMNARVLTQFQALWGSNDQRTFTAPAAGSAGAILGNNGTGTAKVAPYALDNYVRLYFGADAMATNGLRYGAGIELRENFTGQQGSSTSTNASGYTCSQTIYVRRAFTYLAGDQWGIIRLGQTDGHHRHLRQRRDDEPVHGEQFQWRRHAEPAGRWRSVLVCVIGRRRVRQRQGGVSLTADRRLRFRLPVGAERLERLRHRYRQSGQRLAHQLRQRHGSGLQFVGDVRVPVAVVRSGDPGRRETHEPDRARRALPGQVRPSGRAGLRRLRGQRPCQLHRATDASGARNGGGPGKHLQRQV